MKIIDWWLWYQAKCSFKNVRWITHSLAWFSEARYSIWIKNEYVYPNNRDNKPAVQHYTLKHKNAWNAAYIILQTIWQACSPLPRQLPPLSYLKAKNRIFVEMTRNIFVQCSFSSDTLMNNVRLSSNQSRMDF